MLEETSPVRLSLVVPLPTYTTARETFAIKFSTMRIVQSRSLFCYCFHHLQESPLNRSSEVFMCSVQYTQLELGTFATTAWLFFSILLFKESSLIFGSYQLSSACAWRLHRGNKLGAFYNNDDDDDKHSMIEKISLKIFKERRQRL